MKNELKESLDEKLDLDEIVDDIEVPRWVKKIALICIFGILCMFIGGLGGWKLYAYFHPDKEISIDYITVKLEDASELTTQKITYTSRVPIEKGSIPFINKRGFTMYYNATLRAGVNMKEVTIKKRGSKYIVTLPHAKLLGSPSIDPDSIEFHDEKKAIFNWNKHDDVAEAIKKAEEDINDNPSIDMNSLLIRADEHAEELVHYLLDDTVGNGEVVVKFKLPKN